MNSKWHFTISYRRKWRSAGHQRQSLRLEGVEPALPKCYLGSSPFDKHRQLDKFVKGYPFTKMAQIWSFQHSCLGCSSSFDQDVESAGVYRTQRHLVTFFASFFLLNTGIGCQLLLGHSAYWVWSVAPTPNTRIKRFIFFLQFILLFKKENKLV